MKSITDQDDQPICHINRLETVEYGHYDSIDSFHLYEELHNEYLDTEILKSKTPTAAQLKKIEEEDSEA